MSADTPVVTPAKSKSAPIDSRLVNSLVSSSLPEDTWEARHDAIQGMFSDWQVVNWEDLQVISPKEVNNYVSNLKAGPAKDILSPLAVKSKLQYVVEFARVGQLTDSITIADIVQRVDDARHPTSTTSKSAVTFSTSSDTKPRTVPDLDEFSGLDEHFFAYKESTVDTLGQHGFGVYLTDPSRHDSHRELSESVFFAIRKSLRSGTARNLAQTLYDANNLNPFTLWKDILAYYDTAVNRANVVLFEIKRLLGLRLDANVVPVQFISDFNQCLLKLKQNNAQLASDTDTLRALLLVAIQDDDFESIRDDILKKPENGIESILKDLRERDTSLQIKDAAHDGKMSRSRRTSSASASASSSRW